MKIKQYETIPERKTDGICKKCKANVSLGENDITYEYLNITFFGYGLITLNFICPNCRRKSRLLPKT